MYISIIRHDITRNSSPDIYIIIYDMGLLTIMYMIHDSYEDFYSFLTNNKKNFNSETRKIKIRIRKVCRQKFLLDFA